MQATLSGRKTVNKVKGREIIFKRDEEKFGDWAAILAKTITDNNVEEYFLKHGLYK